MTVAQRVQDFIVANGLPWDAVPHRPSATAAEAAHAAVVPEGRVAKAVLLQDGDGYLVAVVPADSKVDLGMLAEVLGRELRVAPERALNGLFFDCAPGAVPAVGVAYGIPTVWDERLGDRADVYFEGGDHQTLVHVSGAAFKRLMRRAQPWTKYFH